MGSSCLLRLLGLVVSGRETKGSVEVPRSRAERRVGSGVGSRVRVPLVDAVEEIAVGDAGASLFAARAALVALPVFGVGCSAFCERVVRLAPAIVLAVWCCAQ